MSRSDAPRVLTEMDRETKCALVGRLRERDADAFDAIHEAFHARLFTFLLRLSRRRDVAEDLLEETWLRLVKHAPRLRPDTRLGPWLFTVARHLHVSYVRSRVLEDSAVTSLISLWPFSVEQSSPFEATAANELERRIERALASMPDVTEVLLLVAVGGRIMRRCRRVRDHARSTAPAAEPRRARARARARRRLFQRECPGEATR